MQRNTNELALQQAGGNICPPILTCQGVRTAPSMMGVGITNELELQRAKVSLHTAPAMCISFLKTVTKEA